MRRLRKPLRGRVVEVLNRTVQGRFLLLPTGPARERILGALGRSQTKHKMRIHAFIVLSNHFHILLTPRDSKHLADFMRDFESRVASEMGRLYGWKGRLWAGRYHVAEVDDEQRAQEKRFRYLLSNGCKENLVASPLDWPGPSSARALYEGRWTIDGVSYDRTAECLARNAGRPREFRRTERIELSPLPCWSHLTHVEVQRRVRALVHDVEEQTARKHRTNGTQPLGVAKIQQRDPHDTAPELKSKPAPRFHASTKEAAALLRDEHLEFEKRYREVSKRYRAGDFTIEFPRGSFPPPRPFVATNAARAP